MNIRRALATIALLAVVAGASSAATLFVAGRAGEEARDFPTLAEVVELIEADYVNKADLAPGDLEAAAIRGIIEALDDPYTSYASPAQAEVAFDYTGAFDGIGAEVNLTDGQVLIHAPLPDSPAERAGLLPGDVVLSVDGRSLFDMTLLDAVSLIRGPKGTTVTLRVLRPGNPDAFDVRVERDTITIASVDSRLLAEDPRIGYVELSTFQGATPGQFRTAMHDLRSAGAQAYVLDLRNNAGGLVSAAVDIAGEFIDGGVVVALVDSDGEAFEYTASEGGEALTEPLVVLVNGFTASAAEILAGALQDGGRAQVVGSKTFGKGSFNTVYDLRNDGGLFLTTGRWRTPSGRMLEGGGLEPDILIGPEAGPATLARAAESATHQHGGDHIGISPQRQPGRSVVGCLVPVGRVSGDDLIEFGRLAAEYGSAELRLTVQQNVLIPNVPDERLGALLAEPLLGTYSPKPSPWIRW
ncbi:MAG: S41 family peptidase [Chloroflexota bacterium]|nr:S41 family peptidase [Chloroflexota bacterium]